MSWAVGPYELRPHQIEAVEKTRAAMADCKRTGEKPRVVMQGICGFGKTIVSSYLMKSAVAKNKRPAFMVSGRQLVFQKSDKLCDALMPHTVVMADAKGSIGPSASVYNGEQPECAVISKDTYQSLLKNHGVDPFEVGLWIIDEAHTAKSDGWWKIIEETGAPVVGLTATPCWPSGLGMGDRYSRLVVSATHQQLIDGGYIVPCRMIGALGIDTRGLSANSDNGEFVEEQIDSRCTPLVGDFVEEWHRYADGLPTAFYASSVGASIAHADVASQGDGTLFARPRTWVHIDAETPQKERQRCYKGLESGDIDGISNYGVLRVGVDFPFLRCIQLGVAMNSLVSYLQTCGRGGRPSDGKNEFLIIDHGGHIGRGLGWPQADREWRLDDRKPMWEREDDPQPPKDKLCVNCHSYYRATMKACPYCGFTKVKTTETVRTVEGELVELEPPKPKEPASKRLSDEQNRFNKLYYASSRSRSHMPMNFNQLRAMFHRENPHLRIRSSSDGNVTEIVNIHTKAKHRLGFVPKPNSPLWDLPVRSVKSEKLQQPWYA